MSSPRFRVLSIEFYERDVALRRPLRLGAAVCERAPQFFARAAIELESGRRAEGAAAELVLPKWFQDSRALEEEPALAQLKVSLELAQQAYLAGGHNTAFGHSIENYGPQIALGAVQGLNSLTACFGPALLDRALLDAVCRAAGVSFYEAIRENLPGMAAPGWQADLAAFDMDEFLAQLKPPSRLAARGVLDLEDPAAMRKAMDTSEGIRCFRLRLGPASIGTMDVLAEAARLLDGVDGQYQVTLDADELFDDAAGALDLWRRMKADPRLRRLVASVAFIEQPIKRRRGLAEDVSALAEERPLLIDESDDSLEAFPRARRLGYTGVSARTCKGVYKALLNAARCRLWSREEGAERYFLSGEDLAAQPGVGMQQHLALSGLLGVSHAEAEGRVHGDGMAGAPPAQVAAFAQAHSDLYSLEGGAIEVNLAGGGLRIDSLQAPGYATRVHPDWAAMTRAPD